MLNWKMAINCVFAGGEMSRLWVSQGPQDKMDIYGFLLEEIGNRTKWDIEGPIEALYSVGMATAANDLIRF